jgi:hypothetical protein
MEYTRRQTAERWCEATENINPPDSELGMVCAELRALWAVLGDAKWANSVAACQTGEWSEADYELSKTLDAYKEGQG